MVSVFPPTVVVVGGCLEEMGTIFSVFTGTCRPLRPMRGPGGLGPCPRSVFNLLFYLEREGEHQSSMAGCQRSQGSRTDIRGAEQLCPGLHLFSVTLLCSLLHVNASQADTKFPGPH